jgi:outer membrane lipoprotein-sorting protein
MKLKSFIFLAVVLSLFSISIHAQSPGKILSQANKTLGGEKNLKSVNSWLAKGRITRASDGASGNYELQTSKPGFYGENYDLNGYEYSSGYNGKSGWTRDSKNGLRTLIGDAAQDFQAEANYRAGGWINAKADKSKITTGGKSNINGKAANVVVLTNAKGTQIKLYFDAASGLLLREEIPQGDSIKMIDYSDYRKVGNIQQAFSITSKTPDETYEIKLDEIKINQQIAKTEFDFPNVSNEPLPDIKALLSELRSNADKIEKILDNYSYTETRIEREFDKTGNLAEKESETTSLSFYKGYRIRRTIAKNGKTLSASEQASEDKQVEKQIKEIEERIAKRETKELQEKRDVAAGKPSNSDSENNRRVALSDALRGSLLVNPRRERLSGRNVIVFDYEPNPEFKPQTRFEKLFSLCTGAIWVDEADKQVIRLNAVLTKNAGNFIGKAKRGASFTLENRRINDEIWLPALADVNVSVKILFVGIDINNAIRYSDYKRFDTEIKEGKIDEVKP